MIANSVRQALRPRGVPALRTAQRNFLEGMKFRRTNSAGEMVGNLERTLTTGGEQTCQDQACKWFCKQNPMAHYLPYPAEHLQNMNECPHTKSAARHFVGLVGLMSIPIFLGSCTDYRAEHLRLGIDRMYNVLTGDKDEDYYTGFPSMGSYAHMNYYDYNRRNFIQGGSGVLPCIPSKAEV